MSCLIIYRTFNSWQRSKCLKPWIKSLPHSSITKQIEDSERQTSSRPRRLLCCIFLIYLSRPISCSSPLATSGFYSSVFLEKALTANLAPSLTLVTSQTEELIPLLIFLTGLQSSQKPCLAILLLRTASQVAQSSLSEDFSRNLKSLLMTQRNQDFSQVWFQIKCKITAKGILMRQAISESSGMIFLGIKLVGKSPLTMIELSVRQRSTVAEGFELITKRVVIKDETVLSFWGWEFGKLSALVGQLIKKLLQEICLFTFKTDKSCQTLSQHFLGSVCLGGSHGFLREWQREAICGAVRHRKRGEREDPSTSIPNKFGIILWRARGGLVHGKCICSVGLIKDLKILATCSQQI